MMARLGDVLKVSSARSVPAASKNWLLNLDMVQQQTGKVIDYQYVSPDELEGSIISFDTSVVLYSKLRPNLNKVVVPEKDGYCTSEMLPLQPDASRLSREYLAWYLRSDSFVTWAVSKTSGAKMPRLGTKELLFHSIPLPDLPTQRRIAATLDKVSEGIALCKQMLVDLDELVKSQFIEMFGDPVTNTRNLPTDTLANLGELNRGVSKSRPRNLPELLGGPYPLVQTGEVSNCDLYINHYESTYSKLGLAQSKMWPKGTLCITIAANIAQTGILDFDACFPDSVVGFINGDRVTQIYIHYWFSFFQKILDEQAPQVAQKNINLQILRDLSVVVPSLEEQKAFDEFVKQAYKSKLAVQQQLAELETLKKSLMQEYFG